MMRAIGLMSGTSMDAIDAAVVDIETDARDLRVHSDLRVTLRTFVTVPYPAETQAALESLLAADASTGDRARPFLGALASLNVAIGEAFAAAANVARKETGGEADLIGSHGQTLCHQPRPGAVSAMRPSTLQLGEPAVIAERTGLTTIADFRVADVAAGGQGAPLVSYADYMLLRSTVEPRVALNIGGIANVTVIPAGCSASQVEAFDTGPGNMPIDLAVRALFPDGPGYDRNGQIAARGTVDHALLDWLLSDTYFSRTAPKTAGREQFGPEFVARAWERAKASGCERESFVTTMTELVASTIASAVPKDSRRVIAAGGGVHNRALMAALGRRLMERNANIELVTSDAFGLPVDAKEAIAFAMLAFEALNGTANNLPHATGAAHPLVMGKIVPGANFVALMRRVWG